MIIENAIGTRQKEIRLSGEVSAVDFGHDYKYYAVRNDSSSAVYVSTADEKCTAGANGVVCISAGGGYVHYNDYGGNEKIYLLGKGSVTVVAQDNCEYPFSLTQSGGGGGSSDWATTEDIDKMFE